MVKRQAKKKLYSAAVITDESKKVALGQSVGKCEWLGESDVEAWATNLIKV
jgi:hypothetical protein